MARSSRHFCIYAILLAAASREDTSNKAGDSFNLGVNPINSELSKDVRFGEHSGLKSDIA